MGELAVVFEKHSSPNNRIWKLLAYVGRYGHQPVDVACRLTVRDLSKLADCVAELVQAENASSNPQRED